MLSIKIDSVNKFAMTITASITERDFKSEYVFRRNQSGDVTRS